MARINILKRIKVGNEWKTVSIPKKGDDKYDWKALIGRLGLQPQADQNLSAQNPLVDYHRDARGTFLATQAETSD